MSHQTVVFVHPIQPATSLAQYCRALSEKCETPLCYRAVTIPTDWPNTCTNRPTPVYTGVLTPAENRSCHSVCRETARPVRRPREGPRTPAVALDRGGSVLSVRNYRAPDGDSGAWGSKLEPFWLSHRRAGWWGGGFQSSLSGIAPVFGLPRLGGFGLPSPRENDPTTTHPR